MGTFCFPIRLSTITFRKAKNMKRLLTLLLTVGIIVSLFSCCTAKKPFGQPNSEPENHTGVASETQAEANSEKESETVTPIRFADAAGDFDGAFLSYISESMDGNYMVSPLSFRYALGLLLAGADGSSCEELLKALGISSVEEWNAYAAAFSKVLAEFEEILSLDLEDFEQGQTAGYIDPDAEPPFRALRVANSVWKNKDIKEAFAADYKKAVSEVYSAEYEDFTEDNAVKKINAWANEKTEGMIPSLLPEGYDTKNLAVVLMNALYFKDAWVEQFYFSEEGDFTAENGEKVKKNFMQKTSDYLYYEDGDTQLVSLPMEDGVNMAFVLGATGNITEKLSQAESCEVAVTIPKIDLETSLSNGELVNFLMACGVEEVFTDRADFSRMINYPVFVSDIIQKTRLKLDEEGVEAAAVTAVMMAEGSCIDLDKPEPVVFTADRPFSFYIYTRSNATVFTLFAGEIVE